MSMASFEYLSIDRLHWMNFQFQKQHIYIYMHTTICEFVFRFWKGIAVGASERMLTIGMWFCCNERKRLRPLLIPRCSLIHGSNSKTKVESTPSCTRCTTHTHNMVRIYNLSILHKSSTRSNDQTIALLQITDSDRGSSIACTVHIICSPHNNNITINHF